MTTLPERLLELAADFDTCIPFLPEPGQRNIAKRTKELRDLAAQSLQAAPDGGEWWKLSDMQVMEFLRVAFRHNDISGEIALSDIRMGLHRASMFVTSPSAALQAGEV